jgi:hypothetical protein
VGHLVRHADEHRVREEGVVLDGPQFDPGTTALDVNLHHGPGLVLAAGPARQPLGLEHPQLGAAVLGNRALGRAHRPFEVRSPVAVVAARVIRPRLAVHEPAALALNSPKDVGDLVAGAVLARFLGLGPGRVHDDGRTIRVAHGVLTSVAVPPAVTIGAGATT